MKKIVVFALAAFALLSCGGSGSQNPNAKNGALPGKFSVSAETQIQFSQGNLQYQPSTKTWRFAQNQFDTIGSSNALIAEDYEGWIDLFGWSTANNPTLTSKDNQAYPDFTDWGTNSISNGGGNNAGWRTLTFDEWQYLFAKRDEAKNKYGVGEVNGIQGLEKNGAVFLPEAGEREGTKIHPDCGHYWTATDYNYAQAYNIFVSPIGFNYKCWSGRKYGESVRLVK